MSNLTSDTKVQDSDCMCSCDSLVWRYNTNVRLDSPFNCWLKDLQTSNYCNHWAGIKPQKCAFPNSVRSHIFVFQFAMDFWSKVLWKLLSGNWTTPSSNVNSLHVSKKEETLTKMLIKHTIWRTTQFSTSSAPEEQPNFQQVQHLKNNPIFNKFSTWRTTQFLTSSAPEEPNFWHVQHLKNNFKFGDQVWACTKTDQNNTPLEYLDYYWLSPLL